MLTIKAPQSFLGSPHPRVFLAGSIEMGKATNWQAWITEQLRKFDGTILNPRRSDWDSSWKQEINNPQFRQQVEWELDALNIANLILFYFEPGTKSPISLLELGLFRQRNLVVCCPYGFYRKGNVDIVCNRYRIHQVPNLEQLAAEARGILTRKDKQ